MNLTTWVDVAIGLTVIYLGASLFVTVINEYIAQAMNLRGRQLHDALGKLINDENVKKMLIQSPALKSFFDARAADAPSYVDTQVLSRLLIGGLAAGASAGETVKQVTQTLENLPDSHLKSQLLALVQTAGGTSESLVKAVSDWAERSLTLLGEGYKRNMHKISFGIGLVVAVGFNLNTVALTEHLYRDKEAREAAAALGVQIAEKTDAETFKKCMELNTAQRNGDTSCASLVGLVETVQGRNATLGKLPIGWSERAAGTKIAEECAWNWIVRITGWLLTALALSLGAPFWFDLLDKLVSVRYGLRPPQQKDEKSGK
jgi:hypothetical protein